MTAIFLWTLVQSIKAAAVVVGIFALRRLYGPTISPVLRCWLWSFVPLVLIMPGAVPLHFSAKITSSIMLPNTPREFSAASTERFTAPVEWAAQTASAESTPPIFLAASTSADNGYAILATAVKIAAAVWLLGMIAAWGRLVYQAVLCRRLVRMASDVLEPEFAAVYRQALENAGIAASNAPELLLTVDLNGPALVGVVRPKILFPCELAESLPAERLEAIFLHELAHFRRRDLWTNWGAAAILAVHWFNPFLRFAASAERVDQEEAADIHVLTGASRIDRAVYAETLYEIIRHESFVASTPGLAGMISNSKQIQRRIEMMTRIGTWKIRRMILAAILAAVGTAVIASLSLGEEKTPEKPRPKPSEKSPSEPAFDRPKEEVRRYLQSLNLVPYSTFDQPMEEAREISQIDRDFSATLLTLLNIGAPGPDAPDAMSEAWRGYCDYQMHLAESRRSRLELLPASEGVADQMLLESLHSALWQWRENPSEEKRREANRLAEEFYARVEERFKIGTRSGTRLALNLAEFLREKIAVETGDAESVPKLLAAADELAQRVHTFYDAGRLTVQEAALIEQETARVSKNVGIVSPTPLGGAER